jgi:hypothetical protein
MYIAHIIRRRVNNKLNPFITIHIAEHPEPHTQNLAFNETLNVDKRKMEFIKSSNAQLVLLSSSFFTRASTRHESKGYYATKGY